MQTLPSFGKAEPTGWISARNAFVGSEGSLNGREGGSGQQGSIEAPPRLLGGGGNSTPGHLLGCDFVPTWLSCLDERD